ncbi:T7SS effector LXG polymorphic toxin [Priestia megaterium]|uniref:T7SS effector LXG polymorphic toxin n=1 Tax=Priestia megaterium TaxID=1404 RepID=UPI003008088C
MGKVYEASSLLAYAKERVSTYKKLNQELGELKKALQGVANLDTEFQGKGADQIKKFYQMQVDVVGYWEALVSANYAYFSVLSEHAHEEKLDGHTIVDVSFLEHELEVANNQSTQMIEAQHKDLKDILNDIHDILPLDAFSTKDVQSKLKSADKKRTSTITAVEKLDYNWSTEYASLDENYQSVKSSVDELEALTSQGSGAYQVVFDTKAYHNSEKYKVQQKISQNTKSYLKAKKEEKTYYENKRQAEIEANKPWYEKTWEVVSTFTGEATGYYDYKRATEGVDPVTGKKLSATQRATAAAMAAAGFIPVVGWIGKGAKGAKGVYKAGKGMNAAHDALLAYKNPKSFHVLQNTEKGLYGLVGTNGTYEYVTGKDVLGNKLDEDERKSALIGAFGGLFGSGAGAVITQKVAKDTKEAIKGAKVLGEQAKHTFKETSNLANTTGVQRHLAFAGESAVSESSLYSKSSSHLENNIYKTTSDWNVPPKGNGRGSQSSKSLEAVNSETRSAETLSKNLDIINKLEFNQASKAKLAAAVKEGLVDPASWKGSLVAPSKDVTHLTNRELQAINLRLSKEKILKIIPVKRKVNADRIQRLRLMAAKKAEQYANQVRKNQAWTLQKTHSKSKQDSVILSDELKNAGIIRPKNSQAHHIVPVNDGGMREYLEKYGIDINSAANGVFITAKEFKFWPGQVVHHLYGDYWLTGKSFWGHGKAYKKHLDVELRRIDSLNISPLMKKDLILELLEDTREGLFTGRIDFLYKN